MQSKSTQKEKPTIFKYRLYIIYKRLCCLADFRDFLETETRPRSKIASRDRLETETSTLVIHTEP